MIGPAAGSSVARHHGCMAEQGKGARWGAGRVLGSESGLRLGKGLRRDDAVPARADFSMVQSRYPSR